MKVEIRNNKLIGSIPDGIYELKKFSQSRSLSQNSALHKFCQLLAEELEEKHIDKRVFFKEPFFLSWSTMGVKDDIWRPTQQSLFSKESTTELSRSGEIDLIWDNINRAIIEKCDGNVDVPPWPSNT